MTDRDQTPELLSPAGNWDCARAAVVAGADAIYFGLPAFNARLRADNFTDADLPELMTFLHAHGVKGFVTMNTLIFTGELEAAAAQLQKVAEAGVDALIIQDVGLAKMVRELAPEVELHASTQMTISSPEGLAFVEGMFPMERAVLARELSVEEIGRFEQARMDGDPGVSTPLEVFVHGALCVAYSGQCLTSESLGQRSANRGECAQACRMPYELVVDGETREMGEVQDPLSPQDLAAVDLIPQQVPLAAGDGVVFDAGENRDHEQGGRIWTVEGRRLTFHRTRSGIDFARLRPGHTLYKTSDPKLESEIRKFWRNAKLERKRDALDMTVQGRPGERLVASARDVRMESRRVLEPAARHPLSTEVLVNQLGRLGGTGYELGTLMNGVEGDCHLPVSELNRMRRGLVEKLEAGRGADGSGPMTPGDWRSLLPKREERRETPEQLSVLCRTMEQVESALAAGVGWIYCDFEDPRRYKEAVAVVREADGVRVVLATPRIVKPGETGFLKQIDRFAADGVLMRNLAALNYYKDRGDVWKVADFSLNVANPVSARLLKEEAGLDVLTVSYDLNISQVLDLLGGAPPDWFELTLHQHMPLFHMEHCVFCTFMSSGTTYKDCGRPCEKHVVHLRDRVGHLHRLQADVGCRNTLFNGRAQTGARFFDTLRKTGLERFRVELLDEDAKSAEETIRAYQKLLAGEENASMLLARVTALEKLGVTEGTLG